MDGKIDFEYEVQSIGPNYLDIILLAKIPYDVIVDGKSTIKYKRSKCGQLEMTQEEFDRFCVLIAKGKVFEDYEPEFREAIKEATVGTGG